MMKTITTTEGDWTDEKGFLLNENTARRISVRVTDEEFRVLRSVASRHTELLALCGRIKNAMRTA